METVPILPAPNLARRGSRALQFELPVSVGLQIRIAGALRRCGSA